VDLLACSRLDDVLPELAHQDRAAAKLGVFLDHLEDIALLGRRAEAEQQIGRGEVKEMQHMALHHLSVMHQPAHLLRRGRDSSTPTIMSIALAAARWWLTGQMPHSRCTITGTSHSSRRE
jgi:hypothetical protein